MEKKINTFDDLIEFMNDNELEFDQLRKIVFETFQLIIVCTPTKELLIERLKLWWAKKQNNEPWGIFLETTEQILAELQPPHEHTNKHL